MALSTCLCKSILGFLNVIIMLIGLAIALVGVLLQVAAGSTLFEYFEKTIKEILVKFSVMGVNNTIGNIKFQDLFETASIVLIVVGLFIACVAFLGCCGASCNYRIILILYSIVLGVLIAVQIIVVALFFSKTFDDEIKKQAQKTIDKNFVGIDDSSPASVVWNVLMLKFECCGLNGSKDFDTAEMWNRTRELTINNAKEKVNLTTPIACCAYYGDFPDIKLIDPWCAVYPNETTSNFQTGCWGEVTKALSPHRTNAILVISAIIVIEAAVLLVTIIIIKSDKSKLSPM